MRRFANKFHEWRSHSWKSLANRFTSNLQIVIHGNDCIISFLTRLLCPERTIPPKTSIADFVIVFSDVALWRHHSWSVTSRERGVLALWRRIRRLFLYAQIGAKAIFTSEYQPWISISQDPVFTTFCVRKRNSDSFWLVLVPTSRECRYGPSKSHLPFLAPPPEVRRRR